jgi:hypothetical protein
MADTPFALYVTLGLFAGVIALGFYQTYAMIQNPTALQTVAKGEAVALGAAGIGEAVKEVQPGWFGIGNTGDGGSGGRRKTKKGKRRGRKTYRKTK